MRTLLLALLPLTTCFATEPALPPRLALEGEITEATGGLLAEEIDDAVREKEPVLVMQIDSPGGDVGAGFLVISALRRARRAGTTSICIVDGRAASMAAVILEACSVRTMTRSSALMFHEPSGEAGGTASGLRRIATRLDSLTRELAIFAAGRMKISVSKYLANTADADWWLSAEEALAVGAVDRVLD